jgi:hypothetical protein
MSAKRNVICPGHVIYMFQNLPCFYRSLSSLSEAVPSKYEEKKTTE